MYVERVQEEKVTDSSLNKKIQKIREENTKELQVRELKQQAIMHEYEALSLLFKTQNRHSMKNFSQAVRENKNLTEKHVKQAQQIQRLNSEYAEKENQLKKERMKIQEKYQNLNRELTTEKEAAISQLKTRYEEQIHTAQLELQTQKKHHLQMTKKNESTIKNIKNQSDKILFKNEKMKGKWNRGIRHVINKKNKIIETLSLQYEDQKNKLIQSSEEKIIDIKAESEKEKQRIKEEFEKALKRKSEEKSRMIEELKKETEEQYNIDTQYTQELIHKQNKAIKKIQEEHQQQSREVAIQNQKAIMEKEKIISELNRKVENRSQSYAFKNGTDHSHTGASKTEKRSQKIKTK